MTSSATEFETDLVDLSRCGLDEVMSLRDARVVEALDTLVRHLGVGAMTQRDGSGSGSTYFVARCGGDDDGL